MNLENSIKALKTPPSRGWLRDKWTSFVVWWSIYVWTRFAPQWLYSFWHDVESFYYEQISSRIWPRQAWLTKAVGRQWTDKVNLIPTMLYASIVHLTSEEGEDCFNACHWESETEAKLREIAAWALRGRERYIEAIHAALPPLGEIDWKNPPFDQLFSDDLIPAHIPPEDHYAYKYEVHNALEAQFDKKDTDYLRWIVDNKDQLWT